MRRFSDGIRNLIRNYLDTHRHGEPSFPLYWVAFGKRPFWHVGTPLPSPEECDAIFEEMIKRNKGSSLDYLASILEGKHEKVYIA